MINFQAIKFVIQVFILVILPTQITSEKTGFIPKSFHPFLEIVLPKTTPTTNKKSDVFFDFTLYSFPTPKPYLSHT